MIQYKSGVRELQRRVVWAMTIACIGALLVDALGYFLGVGWLRVFVLGGEPQPASGYLVVWMLLALPLILLLARLYEYVQILSRYPAAYGLLLSAIMICHLGGLSWSSVVLVALSLLSLLLSVTSYLETDTPGYALWLGVFATGCIAVCPPAVWLLPMWLIGLRVQRSLSPRTSSALLIGVVSGSVLMVSGLFALVQMDILPQLSAHLYAMIDFVLVEAGELSWLDYIPSIGMLLLSAVALATMGYYIRRESLRERKQIHLLALWVGYTMVLSVAMPSYIQELQLVGVLPLGVLLARLATSLRGRPASVVTIGLVVFLLMIKLL